MYRLARWTCALLVLTSGALAVETPRAQSKQAFDAQRLGLEAAKLPQLHTLRVSHRGTVTGQYDDRPSRRTALANIKSASKSIVTLLVGIARERGQLPTLDTPIARWFPALRTDPDARKRTITLGHLLTMQSGLESTSGEGYGRWVSSRNWVTFALARPMVEAPGTGMQYSTGTSHLLSAILTKATGRSTHAYAQQVLATPLGFTLARWPTDRQGIFFGGNEMLLTPAQMVSIGELWRNRGRVGGRQVVPDAWVTESCTPRTRSVWDTTREYGYGWWIQDIGGQRSCFAWGFGGQYIMVFPALDLVVTATSSTTMSEDRHGHRAAFFDLLRREVLEPLASR
ncbi:MAG TPA: serine hydrolase [Luteitalea sp.]|nr:serine hydrolase [Luteitalea sp.]